MDVTTLKRQIKTTYRLPTLQLAVLKPNDTKDTFWYTTNDEKIINEIDFSAFEEAFKLNPAPIKKAGGRDEPDPGKVPAIKTPQLKSLMEHTRLKNVAICKRRLPPMPLDDIMAAVNALDNSTISLDAIELLQRIEPNAEEIKAYREFSFKKQDPNELTEEDRQARKTLCLQFCILYLYFAFFSNFVFLYQTLSSQVYVEALKGGATSGQAGDYVVHVDLL